MHDQSDDAQLRLDQLAERHRALSGRFARMAEHSAAVHDAAAELHEELGQRALLDPAALREHADADRELAARERESQEREARECADGDAERPPG